MMESGISECWRRNTSIFEAVELANLLHGMRKVAGHMGQNVGRIEYAGMSREAEAAIIIEPGLVMGRYPVPPAKVDRLVGVVVHEALHGIEWSDRVWKLLEPAFRTIGGLSLVRFQKIIHVGEDIYVDSLAEKSTFGLYTLTARGQAFAAADAKLRSGELSVDALVHLWWTGAWDRQSSRDLAEGYFEPLQVLERLTEELRIVAEMKRGVTERCQRRAELYLESWQVIQGLISSWTVINKTLHWHWSFFEPGRKEPEGDRRKSDTTRKNLPPSVLHQVEIQLAMHSADITPIIQSIVGYQHEDVAPTSRWDSNISASPVIDHRLVARLKAVFRNYSACKTVVSRGMVGGKVDSRRLYRAPISGRCFLQVDKLADPDWNVVLLMDASGSMRGNKWRMAESAVANLHKALTGFQIHLQAYAYYEVDGVCMISQLIKDRQLLSVRPSGQTASGQAIIAAAYFVPRRRRRNLLIHVTDGESNYGCDVQYGIEYCRKRRIHLVTLGCGYKDREAMLRQYGKSLQFLDHFGQLPRTIERLLKWTFLYGEKRRLWTGAETTTGQSQVC